MLIGFTLALYFHLCNGVRRFSREMWFAARTWSILWFPDDAGCAIVTRFNEVPRGMLKRQSRPWHKEVSSIILQKAVGMGRPFSCLLFS